MMLGVYSHSVWRVHGVLCTGKLGISQLSCLHVPIFSSLPPRRRLEVGNIKKKVGGKKKDTLSIQKPGCLTT